MTNTSADMMSTVSWTLLGVVLNVLFLGHGILLMSGMSLSSNLSMVGAMTTLYAVGCSGLLLAAWLSPVRAVFVAAALLTGVYAATIVTMALQLDVIRSFTWLAGVVLLLAFVIANLLAIHRVQTRTSGGHR